MLTLQNILKNLFLFVSILLITGWTGWNTCVAQDIIPNNSSNFTKALHKEYLVFVEAKVKLENWQSADYFARKAVAAASGEIVLPEDPAVWDIPAKDMDELLAARTKFIDLLDQNTRLQTPDLAARAQVNYDCWVEGRTLAHHYTAKAEACRCNFYNNLTEIEKTINTPPLITPKQMKKSSLNKFLTVDE